jgi:acetylornithine deacetylase/succinyl-diaminopimelate desuccinylase-like protein
MIDRRSLMLAGAAGAMLPTAGFGANLKSVRAAVDKQLPENIARIQDWIRNPGIAAENFKMEEACAFSMGLLKDAGFQMVKRMPTAGHPGIFATLDVGAKRTMGIYFMYDVKQVTPEEWSYPPFDARIINKPGWGQAIIGRGAINQKGPQAAFLAALHAMRAAGQKLPVNLVLVAEGEEEIASPNFRDVVTDPQVLAALKKCEGVIIPTAWQGRNGAVSINLGAKGAVEFELIASGERWGRGPKGDIHSSYKAMVDSPAWRLVAALKTLVSDDGNTVLIDGFQDNVRPLTAREKELVAVTSAASNEADMKAALGVKLWIDDLPFPKAMERLAQAPTLNIQGLVGGYTGQGGKTVLPGKMTAKCEFRLVPNQTKAEVLEKLRAHLDKRGFTDIEMKVTGGYGPTETAENSRVIRAQQAVYGRAGVAATLYPRLAGSWPGEIFTGPPVSLPAGQFGLGHGSGAHAPDEYFVVESINPKVEGLAGCTMGFVDFLYEMAVVS